MVHAQGELVEGMVHAHPFEHVEGMVHAQGEHVEGMGMHGASM